MTTSPAGGETGSPSSSTSPSPGRDGFSDWPAPFRWVVYVVVVALVLGLLAAAGGWWVARRSLPQTGGTLHVAGLQGAVVVRRDAQGVPQIYARTSHDLFAAQGFVQAQDRFWQMDYARHAASGQLAEIFGSRMVPRDELARTLGWRRTAERELTLLDTATREALTAFSEGVDAYLDQHLGSDNSLEFSVVSLGNDYRPADWSPVDSLAVLKQLAWEQSGGLHEEVQRAALAASPAPRGAASLYPAYALGAGATVTGGPATVGDRVQPEGSSATTTGVSGGLLDQLGDDLAAEDPLTGSRRGTAGSAWAVSGRLTTSGQPLLAQVPGQTVGLPGAAYQSGLHCARVGADCPYDVTGLAHPGVPGIVSGHNDDVAWALNPLSADLVDLYLEDVRAGTVLTPAGPRPLTSTVETIRVAGGPSRRLVVRSTPHGPLVSGVSRSLADVGRLAPAPVGSPDRGDGYAVALRWAGATPRASVDAILALDRARSATGVREAAASIGSPATGVLYASRGSDGGVIGYQAAGAIPAREAGQGLLPSPGWSTPGDPPRLVARDRLPHEEDPASGVIVSAGQPPSADTTTLGDSWSYGAKAERIRRLLASRTAQDRRLRASDLSAVAADTHSPTAPALVPYLLDVPISSAYVEQGRRLLRGWRYDQPAGSAAAAFYNVVWRNVLALTFHDQLPPRLWPADESRWTRVVANLLARPDDPWWDDATTDDRVERRDDVLRRALYDARDEMTRLQARDPARWDWGRLHRLDLDRPGFEESRLGRWLFDRDANAAAGGPGAVQDTTYDPRRGYAVTAAPAARLVSDLAQPDRSRWVALAGTSGHVFGPHYTDQLGTWLRGASYPWVSSAAAVRASARHSLVLR